jgi:DNA-binding CsgD family transcriptional regulator
MHQSDVHLKLLEDLLAAPGSAAGWQTFLLDLCDALNGTAANFIFHSFADSRADVFLTARTDCEALALYREHWHRFDPWAHAPSAGRLQAGMVVVGDQLIAPEQLKRTAFYNDFSRQYDIAQCIAGMIEASPRTLSCMSINGAEGRKPFDADDAALLGYLMPHVQRAVQTHRRLQGTGLMAADLTSVLDKLPHGVVLVSAADKILLTNRAADEILRARDGVLLDHGQLRAATVSLTRALHAAINLATGAAVDMTGGRETTATLLPRPSGRRPLSVLVAPLPKAGIEFGPAATAAIFMTDPDRTPVTHVEAIGSMFHLTPSEARLVQCLVEGDSLGHAAERLAIRLETARKRVKVVFHKTDTHRQTDLVRLVLTSPLPALA